MTWPITSQSNLSRLCNVGLEALGACRPPPVGDQVFHGLPFRIGDPANPEAPCFVLIGPGEAVTVPIGRAAERVVLAHRRLPLRQDDDVTVSPAPSPASRYPRSSPHSWRQPAPSCAP
jgi:hypothetical protein